MSKKEEGTTEKSSFFPPTEKETFTEPTPLKKSRHSSWLAAGWSSLRISRISEASGVIFFRAAPPPDAGSRSRLPQLRSKASKRHTVIDSSLLGTSGSVGDPLPHPHGVCVVRSWGCHDTASSHGGWEVGSQHWRRRESTRTFHEWMKDVGCTNIKNKTMISGGKYPRPPSGCEPK